MKNCRLCRPRNKVRRPEGKPIIQFRVYCPKQSKCHALARFVWFVWFVFEKKHSRMLSWTLISLKRIYTMSQPKKIRPIRTIRVQKNIRVWIILYWPLISRIPRIYTMSQPKKIRQIRPIRVQKYIRVWIILTWPLISRIKRIYTMSRPTRFVRFVRLVFEKKHSRTLSWTLIFRIKRII